MRELSIIVCLVLTIVAILALACYKGNKAERFRQEARKHTNRCEWKQAIECYDKALVESPKNATYLARRGFAYACLGNSNQALADFTSAIESDKNCPDAYSRRSRLYSWLGLNSLSKPDAEKALELIGEPPKETELLLEYAGLLNSLGKQQESDQKYKQVLASLPQDEDVSNLLMATSAHAGLRQNQDSADCMSKAIKLQPENWYLRYLRSFFYLELGQYSLATTELNLYAENGGKNPFAFACRGNIWYGQSQLNDAIADFDHAIKLAPNFQYAFQWRGRAYHALNDYQKAIQDYTSAIKLEPTDADSFLRRADNYCHLEEWHKALTDTQQAMLLDPKSAKVYTTQAWAHDALGRFEEAMADFDKAIALTPEDSNVYYLRGMRYRKRKHYKRAIDDLTESIKYDPTNAISYCARGSALLSARQYERAIADCTQSIKLNPKRTHPLLSRGIAHFRLGRHKLALQDFDEAIKKFPEYGEAFYERSLVYKSLGKIEQAELDMQKAKKFGYGSPEEM